MISKSNGRVREAAAGLMGEPGAGTLRSLKRVEQLIARYPSNASFQVQKGELMERMLKFGVALRCYNQALASAPGDLTALLAKASLLERSSRGAQAVKVLALAIACGGNEAALSCEQGRILHELGRLKPALQYYARCLELKPHHKKAATNLAAVMIGLRRYREAIAFCDGELKHNPDRWELLCSRGIAWMELLENGNAMQDYSRALKRSPGNRVVFYNLACLWVKMGNQNKAFAFLARAVKGNARLSCQAMNDPALSPLENTLRFWRIIHTGIYLEGAMLWHLEKRFKVRII